MLMFMKEVKRKYLKMSNKIYVGWNEIEEWDLDLEDIKNTTTNYTLI